MRRRSLIALLAASVVLNVTLFLTLLSIGRPAAAPNALLASTAEEHRVARPDRRLTGHSLGDTATVTSAASHASAGEGSAITHAEQSTHQQDALLFLFGAVLIGTFVLHLRYHFPKLQTTVVLFVLGMIYSFIMEACKLRDMSEPFQHSYAMWMDIDPHMLLFTLLPPLLAGDAMTIDTSVAKRVGWQCLYLAGPGVVVNATLFALFLKGYFPDWDFKLDLTLGAILCATDPVAVVALLKELGASPVLTVQIQGESLLNDGTAIVMFKVAYNMLSGERYDFADLIMFFVKTALMAWALGVFMGYFFFTWIRSASNRLQHSSSMIQFCLTLSCAYASFALAEGVFNISGVLATVAASLVLADHMWPHIVSQDTIDHVWHALENLGNIVIFFLAGALTGRAMMQSIKPIDYLHLLVFYVVLTLIRAFFVMVSRPVLQLLSEDRRPVPWADSIVLSWGGLRGAVGLALAIQVQHEQARTADGVPQIAEEDGRRILFFVSGIAFLTTVINATTAPALVDHLGLLAQPHAQRRLLRMVYRQLVGWANNHEYPAEITGSLMEMLKQIETNIRNTKVTQDLKALRTMVHSAEQSEEASCKHRLSEQNRQGFQKGGRKGGKHFNLVPFDPGERNDLLIARHKDAEQRFREMTEASRQLCGPLPSGNMLGSAGESITSQMYNILADTGVDVGMAKVVNRAFINFVGHQYWRMINDGLLRPGSEEAEILLTSLRMAMSPLRTDLTDFDVICHDLPRIFSGDLTEWWKLFPDGNEDTSLTLRSPKATAPSPRSATERSTLIYHIVNSVSFNVTMMAAIILNAIFVVADEATNGENAEERAKHIAWLVIEVVFNIIFFLEFVLKFADKRLRYFKDLPNMFDFLLVVLGIVGIYISFAARQQDTGASEARIMRTSRVFRVLRFLRVFRLFHAKLGVDKTVRPEIAFHMKRINTLQCFIHAHLEAQQFLVKYFGGNGVIDEMSEAELARCILQSQVAVYRAIELTIAEKSQMDPQLVQEMVIVNELKHITEGLENFVLTAHKDGAISAREAESIVHPMHHQITHCMRALKDLDNGVTRSVNSQVRQSISAMTPQSQALDVRVDSPALEEDEDETTDRETGAVGSGQAASSRSIGPEESVSITSEEDRKRRPTSGAGRGVDEQQFTSALPGEVRAEDLRKGETLG